MSSFVFDQIKEFAVDGTLNFKSVPDGMYRVALLTNTIVDSPETYSKKTLWSEIMIYEITLAQGYNVINYPDNVNGKPGSPLTGVNVYDLPDNGSSGGDRLMDKVVAANDIIYNNSTITADCAVIMRARTDGDYDLITALDIRENGASVNSSNGTFTLLLSVNSGGFLTIK